MQGLSFFKGYFFLKNDELKKRFPDAFNILKPIKKIAKKAGVSLSNFSLSWAYSLDCIDGIIIGVDNLDHLIKNLKNLKQKVNPQYFEEALSVNINNKYILNPSYWE